MVFQIKNLKTDALARKVLKKIASRAARRALTLLKSVELAQQRDTYRQ